MSSDVTKRALSAGLGVGALALLAPRASADTPFSSFAFRATGAPTARTLPDRLGELKTVKDFGALGNGVADDHAAFQAAVNAGTKIQLLAWEEARRVPADCPSGDRHEDGVRPARPFCLPAPITSVVRCWLISKAATCTLLV